MKGDRIAKVLARAGLCSRREAERWIEAGRVSVNGQKLTTPAVTVTGDDQVLVDGNPLPDAEEPRMWRYHKPAGLLTTHSDPEGRPTIFQKMPQKMPRVISVGRLDLNSEGLLLLTNDGGLARRLELPSTGWLRRYRVRVNGRVDENKLAKLAEGVTVEGQRYGRIQAILDVQKGANAWLTVSLAEGKNREIRKVFDHIGYPVGRLIRTAYGPFQLGKLDRGQVEEIRPKVLREQLGLTADKSKRHR
ncbi:Ribosomal large subunit pseudouridine synthase B [Magnetospira sp. QH-2]|nr:pseudouridine synthase [Magnetospira sp. QH-2]CCQ74878.1 Ribosomal large subunit pseudouridine synthase B [Magnetospira sp. QH-2]